MGWFIAFILGLAVFLIWLVFYRRRPYDDSDRWSYENERKRYIEFLERDNPSFPKAAIKDFLKKNGFFDNENWYRTAEISEECQSWIYKTQGAEQWKLEAPRALQRERQRIQTLLARNEEVIKQFGVRLPQFPSWWNNDRAALELDGFFLAIQSVNFCSLVRGMVAKARFGGQSSDPLTPPPFEALVDMSYGEHPIDGEYDTRPTSVHDLKERVVREYETFRVRKIGHVVPPETLLSCLRKETPDESEHFEFGAVLMAFTTALKKVEVFDTAREVHNRFDELVHQQYPLSWLAAFMQDRMQPDSTLDELQRAVYDLEQELRTCDSAMSASRKESERMRSKQAAAEREEARQRAEAEARRVQWVKLDEEEQERKRREYEQSFEGQMDRLRAEHDERMKVIARISDEEARLEAEEIESDRYRNAVRKLVGESAGSKKG